MVAFIWLSLLAAFILLVLLPIMFAELMAVSLAKLHLEPTTALLLVFAVLLGGFINIPIKRIRHATTVAVDPLALFGILDSWPEPRRVRTETILALNVGGCIVPAGLAVYELFYLAALDPRLLGVVGVATVINIVVCYVLARPVPRIGIALPFLVPALVAAVAALLLAPEQAPPIAFIAGVAGPLVGADLLHLKAIDRIPSGVISIGGAGTFDGIVLSGIIAAYLA